MDVEAWLRAEYGASILEDVTFLRRVMISPDLSDWRRDALSAYVSHLAKGRDDQAEVFMNNVHQAGGRLLVRGLVAYGAALTSVSEELTVEGYAGQLPSPLPASPLAEKIRRALAERHKEFREDFGQLPPMPPWGVVHDLAGQRFLARSIIIARKGVVVFGPFPEEPVSFRLGGRVVRLDDSEWWASRGDPTEEAVRHEIALAKRYKQQPRPYTVTI